MLKALPRKWYHQICSLLVSRTMGNFVSNDKSKVHKININVKDKGVDGQDKKSCSKNDEFLPFLSSSWPGSILSWTDEDLRIFAECFDPVKFKDGEELSVLRFSFFIVVEGSVEIHGKLK